MEDTMTDTSMEELLQKVPSTAKIAFYKIAVSEENLQINSEWFEWAAELILAGYTNPHILELSQETNTDNQIHLKGLTNVILDELHIDLQDLSMICKYYGIYLINQGLAENKEVYEILFQLSSIFIFTNYSLFYDFYVLHLAYTELKEEGEQCYWDGMNFKNKEEYTRKYLKQWLKKPGSKLFDKLEKKSSFRRTLELYLFNECTVWLYAILLITLVLIFYWAMFKLSSGNLMSTLLFVSISFSTLAKIVFEIAKMINKMRNQ